MNKTQQKGCTGHEPKWVRTTSDGRAQPKRNWTAYTKWVGVKCGVSLTCEASGSRIVNLRVAQQNAREQVDRLRINEFVIFSTLHDKICSLERRADVVYSSSRSQTMEAISLQLSWDTFPNMCRSSTACVLSDVICVFTFHGK